MDKSLLDRMFFRNKLCFAAKESKSESVRVWVRTKDWGVSDSLMAEEAVLGYLEKNSEIRDSGEFAAELGIDHNEIVNVIKSLHGFGYVDAQDIKRETWVLTDEGKTYSSVGSPEVQLFFAIPPEEGISKQDLQVIHFFYNYVIGIEYHWLCGWLVSLVEFGWSPLVKFFPLNRIFFIHKLEVETLHGG